MQTSVGPFFCLIAKIHVLQGKHMEKRHQPHDQVIGLLDESLRNSDRGFAVLPLFEIVQQGTASRVRPDFRNELPALPVRINKGAHGSVT